MAFDPISHAAGIGAGEAASRVAEGNTVIAEMRVTNAEMRVTNAMIERNQALKKAAALENEIQNKWIPYGVRLQSGIMARRVEKADLIAALKASNPEHAERIAREADAHAHAEYDRLGKPGSKELAEVVEIVKTEAEAGRLG